MCSNGALHFDRVRGGVVRFHPIERSAVGRAGAIVLDAVTDVGLGWELADGTVGWDPLLPTDVETTASGVSFVEITGAGVHKAKGLQAVCEDLGIGAEDVVGFGDNRNDLAMLRWAGLGYAMANANPALAEVADAEAPHHADDGVARVIESLLA